LQNQPLKKIKNIEVTPEPEPSVVVEKEKENAYVPPIPFPQRVTKTMSVW
jgi:hypothetical protein